MVFASGVSALTCLVDGCDEPVVGRGLCRSHYDRLRYSGSPLRRKRTRICLVCARPFLLDRDSRKFCSATCRKRFERLRRSSRVPVSSEPLPIVASVPVADERPRPAMTYEPFTEDDVWAKSRGMCYACGGPASRDFDSPDFGAPAWIVPPEQGGEASFANRAVFHYRCLKRHADGTVSEREARHGRKAGVHNGRKRKKGRAS